MDQYFGNHKVASGLRRCGTWIAAMLLALVAGCGADREAVPDPQKPPLPKTSQYR